MAVERSIIAWNKRSLLPFLMATLLAVSTGCLDVQNVKHEVSPREVVLNEAWEFQKSGDTSWMPAHVPGDVMLDLMRQGRLNDPYQGTNERTAQWVENEDWLYRCVFSLLQSKDSSTAPTQELVFQGIDTYAEIRLN